MRSTWDNPSTVCDRSLVVVVFFGVRLAVFGGRGAIPRPVPRVLMRQGGQKAQNRCDANRYCCSVLFSDSPKATAPGYHTQARRRRQRRRTRADVDPRLDPPNSSQPAAASSSCRRLRCCLPFTLSHTHSLSSALPVCYVQHKTSALCYIPDRGGRAAAQQVRSAYAHFDDAPRTEFTASRGFCARPPSPPSPLLLPNDRREMCSLPARRRRRDGDTTRRSTLPPLLCATTYTPAAKRSRKGRKHVLFGA